MKTSSLKKMLLDEVLLL